MKKLLMIFSLLLILATTHAQELEEDKTFAGTLRQYWPLGMANITGFFDNLGLSARSFARPNFPSWAEIGINIEEDMLFGGCRSVDCDVYYRDLALVSGARIGHAQDLKLIKNGDSFELRKKLILEAKKTIYISVWAIHSDTTGNRFLSWLNEAYEKNPKLDIRVIVDGNITSIDLYGKRYKEFMQESKGKIKTMLWNHKNYRAHVNHRKFIVIDDKHVITGGMNIGNIYSHYVVPRPHDAWRDFDIYMKGKSAAIAFRNLFAEIWNSQIEQGLHDSSYRPLEAIDLMEQETEGSPVLVIDQDPGSSQENARHSIHTAIVKLFRDARHSIDIEHAYLILDPIIRRELTRLIKENKIKVRVFTNSENSVDEGIIAIPILKSARDAARGGADVYLKQGPSQHSKYMIIDNKITMIGSFNMSPRSLRFDAETVTVVFDERLANEFTHAFETGIKNESIKMDPYNYKININFLSALTEAICFDCL